MTYWLPPLPWATASLCSPTMVITPIRSALFVLSLAFAWLVTGQAECKIARRSAFATLVQSSRSRRAQSLLSHSPSASTAAALLAASGGQIGQ